ncbi:MAG TPA: LysM peptidoglycan-binding domain-containing protein [Intrasporangiaceae bacterium]|nr:LysM peptidoglycan-binding domain-containing protein [Intrasporangiaceae bacterium]
MATTQAPTSAGAGWGTYVVKSGDSLYTIAQRHHTTVSALVARNKLPNGGRLIRPGQQLQVPGPATAPKSTAKPAAPAAKPAAAPTTTTYTVRAGDTLIGIAQRHKTTARAIAQLNRISVSATIRVGQKLRVPTDGKTAAKAASSRKPAPKPVPQPEMSTKFNSGGYSASHFPTTTVAAARKNHELLASMSVPTRDQAKELIVATAKKHGVDPALALAIAHQESGFNQRQVSVANAIGIMQVIPSSGDWAGQMVGRKLNLLDAEDNVTAGVAILRSLLRSTKNEEMALAGYYQGLASVRKNGMYRDTRSYIRNIQALRTKYQ